MKAIFYVFILLILISSPVLAATVTLKTNQGEYTFVAGEEARVPFIVESSFPRTNVGDLSYTLTRKESQGGLSYSQSSSQSQSFPISPGSSQNAITLSSADPAEYEVSLSLHFRDDGKDYSADLPSFLVHFISNQTGQSQQSGQGSQGSSPLSSTTREVKPDSQGQNLDPFSEMEQQMNSMRQQNQQMLQQALSSQGMPSGAGQQPQSAQHALQNNQMNAQSSALQKQLAGEAAQREQEEKKLAEQVSGDPLMSQMARSLNQAGYQQKEGTLTPQGKGGGSVSARFENENGQSVDLQGDVKNGSAEQVTARSNESMPVPEALSNNQKYQNQTSQLKSSGYNQTGGSQTMTRNETRVEERYKTEDGKNATVTSVIRNGTVEEVIVKKDEPVPIGWYLGFVLLLILACLCTWAGYRYYLRRSAEGEVEQEGVYEEPPDVREESEKILLMAEAAFSVGRKKDAYALAGQGARFFLSHTLGSGAADTNEEIVSLMQTNGKDYRDVREMLDRCMLVEFAKDDGEEEEFRAIIADIRKMVRGNSRSEPEEHRI